MELRRGLLANCQHPVGFYVRQDLNDTTRPADFDLADRIRAAESKVHSKVARRSVSDRRGHVIVLISDSHDRANSVAIAFGPGQLEN